MVNKNDVKNHVQYTVNRVQRVRSVESSEELGDSHIKDHVHFNGVLFNKKWLCKCDTIDGKERIWVIYLNLKDKILTEEQYKDQYPEKHDHIQ